MVKSTFAAFADRISRADWAGNGLSAMTPMRVKTELLAGLTVALALVPEAVAFAFVAGVAPLVGLYAAFIVGTFRRTARHDFRRNRRAGRCHGRAGA